MNELALFAGAGGGILAGKLLGWRTVAAVEWEPYPASVLIQRQNDGILPPFPVWDDVQTFDGRPWKGIVDVVSGGFPCQDISSAGKGSGINGDRSSMWYHMLRVIKEVRPKYAFIENSPHLRTKGLTTVLQGLAEVGYDAAWGVLSAEDCGANHQRKRMWILASDANLCSKSTSPFHAKTQGVQGTDRVYQEEVPHPDLSQCERGGLSSGGSPEYPDPGLGTWWATTPSVYRVDDEVAFAMDRLKAIGNGQVPIVAATAFTQLKELIDNNLQSVKVQRSKQLLGENVKTATLIKNLPTSKTGATQALYLMVPPIKEEGCSEDGATLFWNYVVVSAVDAQYTGIETYIFPANEHGKIVCWGELKGSMKGTLSHAEALANAGYTITQLAVE